MSGNAPMTGLPDPTSQPRTSTRNQVLIVVAFIVALIVAVYVDRSETTGAPGAGDVTVTSCTGSSATMTVDNSGSGTATYVVTVAFESGDGATQYGTAVVTVTALAAGQRTTVTATSFDLAERLVAGACRVVNVSRF